MFFIVKSLKFVHIAGIGFFKTQAGKIEHEADSHRPSGFEIVFPAMLKEAKILGLDLPYELPFIKQIMEKRDAKLKRLNSDNDSALLFRKFSSLKVIIN